MDKLCNSFQKFNLKNKLIKNIQFNKTYTYKFENISFDNLPKDTIYEIYKDGRVFSHLIERWIENVFPLKWIPKCKTYDFIDINHNQYDQKTFTKNGCKFMPSNMIGTGRKFNREKFLEKSKSLNYIIVDNIEFPLIKLKFIKGIELSQKYPKGVIKLKDRNTFFYNT